MDINNIPKIINVPEFDKCHQCVNLKQELTDLKAEHEELKREYNILQRNHGVEDKEDKPKRLGRWGHRQA